MKAGHSPVLVLLAGLTALVLACSTAAPSPTPSPSPTPTPTPVPSPTLPPVTPTPAQVVTPSAVAPATMAAALDPCALLTEADASAFLGITVLPGQPSNPDNPSCTYNTPTTGPTAQLAIYLGDGAKKFYDIDKQLQHAFTPVPDLGDEAYAEANGIFFRQGELWVGISFLLLDTKDHSQKLAELARTVSSRL